MGRSKASEKPKAGVPQMWHFSNNTEDSVRIAYPNGEVEMISSLSLSWHYSMYSADNQKLAVDSLEADGHVFISNLE